MISNLPTYSWKSIRLPKGWRLTALAGVALFGGALLVEPWVTLSAVTIAYLVAIPFSLNSYRRIRRQAAVAGPAPEAPNELDEPERAGPAEEGLAQARFREDPKTGGEGKRGSGRVAIGG